MRPNGTDKLSGYLPPYMLSNNNGICEYSNYYSIGALMTIMLSADEKLFVISKKMNKQDALRISTNEHDNVTKISISFIVFSK